MPVLRLNDRTLTTARGPDAESLLQGVLTPDLKSLPAGEARAGALLTPQGKILFDFLISRIDDGFRLETAQGNGADFLKRLMLYRLRAKVEIAALPDAHVTVLWDTDATGALRDSRFKGAVAVYRSYSAMPDGEEADASAYDALRIAAGVAESGRDYVLSDAFPHDVLFDLDGGVSFTKGCFVGQEVVSRMQHRGTARKRIVIVEAQGPLPGSGSALEANGRPVGTLGTVVGGRGLAIVRADRVASALASGTPITAGGVQVTLSFPAWTGLSFAGPEKDDEQ